MSRYKLDEMEELLLNALETAKRRYQGTDVPDLVMRRLGELYSSQFNDQKALKCANESSEYSSSVFGHGSLQHST